MCYIWPPSVMLAACISRCAPSAFAIKDLWLIRYISNNLLRNAIIMKTIMSSYVFISFIVSPEWPNVLAHAKFLHMNEQRRASCQTMLKRYSWMCSTTFFSFFYLEILCIFKVLIKLMLSQSNICISKRWFNNLTLDVIILDQYHVG